MKIRISLRHSLVAWVVGILPMTMHAEISQVELEAIEKALMATETLAIPASASATSSPATTNLTRDGYEVSRDESAVWLKPGTKTEGNRRVNRLKIGTPLTILGSARDNDGDLWYQVQFRDQNVTKTGYLFSGRVKAIDTAHTEGRSCPDGVNCGQQAQGLQSVAQKIESVQNQDIKGYRLGSWYNARCSKFINKDGLGEWGRAMLSAVDRIDPKCFYDRKFLRYKNIFQGLCPNYLSLSKSQKRAFIALVFASMAESESDCNPKARNPHGTNDVAMGLFQLENSPRQRRAAGRDRKWCRTQQNVDTRSLQFQSECAVSIISDTVCSWRTIINDPENYWEVLRPRSKSKTVANIRATAKRWGLCR